MPRKEYVEDRHRRLIEFLNGKNRADVGELAAYLGVTEATIRRDLLYLEKRGLVYRAHGGALRREPVSIWQTTRLQDRMAVHLEDKRRIADFVVQLIHDGESLMIDGGSTTLIAARSLCARKNLLVVSNSPAIGELMIDANDTKVLLTGGEILKGTYSLIGSDAENSLKRFRTDKAILGMSGILVDEGCFAAVPQEAEIKRLMSLNSRETIVVTDSSKIGTRAFCFVCDFARVGKLVTDRNLTASDRDRLTEQGVEVFCV